MTLDSDRDVQRSPDDRLYLPAYTYADAGRYARLPAQSVRNWFRGQSAPGHTMRPVFGEVPDYGLSYMQLVEVAFVAAMRARKLKLQVMRTAYDYVRRHMGIEYPFAQERFLTDGIDLFLDALDNPNHLVSVSRPGQRAWREALERSTANFDYINHVALRWHPRGRDLSILIDPRISFGRPVIEGTGIPTTVIYERRQAGEDLDFIAEDFGLTREQVKDALWFESSNRAA